MKKNARVEPPPDPGISFPLHQQWKFEVSNSRAKQHLLECNRSNNHVLESSDDNHAAFNFRLYNSASLHKIDLYLYFLLRFLNTLQVFLLLNALRGCGLFRNCCSRKLGGPCEFVLVLT